MLLRDAEEVPLVVQDHAVELHAEEVVDLVLVDERRPVGRRYAPDPLPVGHADLQVEELGFPVEAVKQFRPALAGYAADLHHAPSPLLELRRLPRDVPDAQLFETLHFTSLMRARFSSRTAAPLIMPSMIDSGRAAQPGT